MEKAQISIEEIIQHIKKEFQQSKIQQEQREQRANDVITHSKEKFSPLTPIRLSYSLPEQRIEIKDSYNVNELLTFHDAEFIKNAYRAILRREPDQEGYKHYLNGLRNGNFSKIEILGKLYYSPEAKQNKIKIKGLLLSLSIKYMQKIPIIGYIVKNLAGITKINATTKNIETFEAFINKYFTEYLQRQQHILSTIENEINKTIEQINCEIKTINLQIKDNRINIIDQQRRITSLLNEVRKRGTGSVSNPKEQIKNIEEDHSLDAMYVSFEDRFRGSRTDIKERLKVYLPYVKETFKNINETLILDLGCGRGEWLELLKENGFEAIGLDINRVMIEECKKLNLNVVEADLLDYLRRQESNTIAIITGFHILEHLPLKTIVNLFNECLRVLTPGGIVIFETPNPENILVGACYFYIDPTHKKPIPFHTLSFLLENRGFNILNVLFLNPYKDKDFSNETSEFIDTFVSVATSYAIIAKNPI